MRVMLALFALAASSAAFASSREAPAAPAIAESARSPHHSAAQEAVCRDRVMQARAERGLPKLERETADPDKPYFIAAVDKRIDGCSVMVMRNDTSDVRPLPALPNPSPRLTPAQ